MASSTRPDAPVEESWDRIEAWLSAHAPATFEALAPPADPARLASTEREIGRALPEPLRESLLRHDGTRDLELLPPFWTLLSTTGVARGWRIRTRIEDRWEAPSEGGDDEGEGLWWHRQWVPFAADGAGDYLVIDTRPGDRFGRIGNADHEVGCSFGKEAMYRSLSALLETTATALEVGGVEGVYERLVTPEGELDWEII
ncbi:SMI1/KNR4 family protein [Nocardiopsis halophila]|uniref:SMI1/KNR4 family protein n=1 Tax=Nocardiopsis halophila TaxID=141692 RepID=UPI0003451C7F|nr:SMI1/KNR4 family protein [Nocardiopsis halophila]